MTTIIENSISIHLCAHTYCSLQTYDLSRDALLGPSAALWTKLCKYIGFPITCSARAKREMPKAYIDRIKAGAVFCVLDFEEPYRGANRSVLISNPTATKRESSGPENDSNDSHVVLPLEDWLACFSDCSVCFMRPSPRKVTYLTVAEPLDPPALDLTRYFR